MTTARSSFHNRFGLTYRQRRCGAGSTGAAAAQGVLNRQRGRSLRAIVILIVGAMLQPGGAIAQTSDAGVAQSLDQMIESLKLSEQPVPEALAELGRVAGVEIQIDPSATELMPWGADTKLSTVHIENATLRDVLPQILEPLGLEFEAGETGLSVRASTPLKRMNRRATWDDLKLLERCHNTIWSPETIETFTIRFRITSKVDAPAMLAEQMAKSAGGSVAQVLEDATGALGWVWLPNGDHIIIRTMQAQFANFMSRRITVKYANEPLADILLDLADRADTPINLEPGMMMKLPAEVGRHTSLALRNNSIRQGFELLSAHTGIRYSIQRSGISVSVSDTALQGGAPARPTTVRSPYVGKITIHGPAGAYSFDILLREDDLPQDILDYRKQMVDEYIEKMRADMVVTPAE